jgi:hypothetical protein
MKKFGAIVAIFIGLFGIGVIINGCTHSDYVQPVAVQQAPVVAAQAPAVYAAPPVVVQAAPAHDGFLTGMLMGHMMSGGGGGYHAPVQHNTTIVQQSVTRNTIVRPTVAAPRANTYVYRPSVSSRSSSFGSFRRR